MYNSAVDKYRHLRDYNFYKSIFEALGILVESEGFRKFVIKRVDKEIDYSLIEKWLTEDGFIFSYTIVSDRPNGKEKVGRKTKTAA